MQIQSQELVSAAGRELLLELLQKHGQSRLRVTGGSMMPAILPGDVVHLRIVSSQKEEIRVGDVVLFARDGRFFLHRVVGIRRDEQDRSLLITQGDALAASDAPIAAQNVLALATGIERNGGAIPIPPQSYVVSSALRRVSALAALFYVYARLRRRLSA